MKTILHASLLALLLTSVPAARAAEPAPPPPPPTRKAAIFVDNRAGKELNPKVIVLEDFISSRVSTVGFQVINREIVINALKTYTADQPKLTKQEGAGAELDQLLTDNTSALRLAQNLGADLVLHVSIASLGSEKKDYEDKELGLRTANLTHTLRVSYKIVEGWGGGAFMGDTVRVAKTTRFTANLTTLDTDAVNELLDEASLKVTEHIGKRGATINAAVAARPQSVKVTITPRMTDLANLPITVPKIEIGEDGKPVVRGQHTAAQPMDVNVDLDGVSIGSAPATFMVPPGLHKLRLSREGFRDWVRTINCFDNQLLEVSLQMTEAGYQRWKDNTGFLQNLEKDRKLTEAEVKIMEGKAQLLRQSGFRVDFQSVSTNTPLIAPQLKLFK
jgi:hypothetical protein